MPRYSHACAIQKASPAFSRLMTPSIAPFPPGIWGVEGLQEAKPIRRRPHPVRTTPTLDLVHSMDPADFSGRICRRLLQRVTGRGCSRARRHPRPSEVRGTLAPAGRSQQTIRHENSRRPRRARMRTHREPTERQRASLPLRRPDHETHRNRNFAAMVPRSSHRRETTPPPAARNRTVARRESILHVCAPTLAVMTTCSTSTSVLRRRSTIGRPPIQNPPCVGLMLKKGSLELNRRSSN